LHVLKEVVSTRFYLRRNKESVVVVVVVLVEEEEDIFLSFALHPISKYIRWNTPKTRHAEMRPLFFGRTCKKKKKFNRQQKID